MTYRREVSGVYQKYPIVTEDGIVDFWLATMGSWRQGSLVNRLEVYIFDTDGSRHTYRLWGQDGHMVGVNTDQYSPYGLVPHLASLRPNTMYSRDPRYLVQLKRTKGSFQAVAWVRMDDYRRCLATMELRTADTTGLPPTLRKLISKAVSEAMIAPGISGQMPAPGAI